MRPWGDPGCHWYQAWTEMRAHPTTVATVLILEHVCAGVGTEACH